MYTKRQNTTLNCWKLIAALLIMGHHAVEIGQSGDYVFHGAYVYTEFFFMMSGFFLVKSLEEGKVKSITEYSKKMWLKLFPYTSITITIYYVILGLLSGSVREFLRLWLKWPMELFYLSDLHIIGVQLGQLWYIAAILIIMPLFCWLYFKDKDLFKILIWLLPLVWYGYCFTTWGQLGHRGVFIDLIRAVMNLGLGCFSFYISNKISKYEYSTKLKCLGMVIAWGSFIITIYLLLQECS